MSGSEMNPTVTVPQQSPRRGPVLFELGQVFITPTAQVAIASAGLFSGILLLCHQMGHWGDIDDDSKRAHAAALANGGDVRSVFRLSPAKSSAGPRLLVITKADRSSTAVFLSRAH